jgi:hypothetical protein
MSLAIAPSILGNAPVHNLTATPGINNPGTVLTAGAANVKGSWASLVDPVPYENCLAYFVFHNSFLSATRTDFLVDIGIGTSGGGSEQVIIPNYLAGWSSVPAASALMPKQFVLPLFLPKGVRLSARCQSNTASDTVSVSCWLFGGADGIAWATFRGADAYGITSAGASNGTTITPVTTGGGNESAWFNVGSTTSQPYSGLLLGIGGTLADTTTTSIAYHFEIGYSSTTLMEYYMGTNTTEMVSGPIPPLPYFGQIPSGTQLQVRVEQSGTDAQTFDAGLYGLY